MDNRLGPEQNFTTVDLDQVATAVLPVEVDLMAVLYHGMLESGVFAGGVGHYFRAYLLPEAFFILVVDGGNSDDGGLGAVAIIEGLRGAFSTLDDLLLR